MLTWVSEDDVLNSLDFTAIPVSSFATEDVMEGASIGPGDRTFTVGLFTRLQGQQANTPIVRTGNVAAIPNATVAISLSGQIVDSEVYLIEARSMGGLSGSPVWVQETGSFSAPRATDWKKGEPVTACVSTSMYLLGLMHGHWTIRPAEHDRVDFRTGGPVDDSIALGIAVVVPAKKILEILYHPDLVAMRKQSEELYLKQQGGTTTE